MATMHSRCYFSITIHGNDAVNVTDISSICTKHCLCHKENHRLIYPMIGHLSYGLAWSRPHLPPFAMVLGYVSLV